jgi:putative hydrolase of the HAD superfamily
MTARQGSTDMARRLVPRFQISLVGLDADDTLWHDAPVFQRAIAQFLDLMRQYGDEDALRPRLVAAAYRNMEAYGYGARTFVLSMLDAALEIAGEELKPSATREVLRIGQRMMSDQPELLPGVKDALERLAARYRLVVITKGDLFHQERKLASVGISGYFAGVEIVSDKTPVIYRQVFARYGVPPEQAVMVGDSPRSDILPVLEAGSYAALIPYAGGWDHEMAVLPQGHERFAILNHLADLIAWIDRGPEDGE